jgi:hypothetical protein
METGPDFPGEEEGPADAHGADRIQFVGVEENPGLEGFWDSPFPESMSPDAMNDGPDGHGVKAAPREQGPRHRRPSLAMADSAARAVLLPPSDIVEDGGQPENPEIGPLLPSDPFAEPVDALGVVPIVTAAGLPEKAPSLLPDRGQKRR